MALPPRPLRASLPGEVGGAHVQGCLLTEAKLTCEEAGRPGDGRAGSRAGPGADGLRAAGSAPASCAAGRPTPRRLPGGRRDVCGLRSLALGRSQERPGPADGSS